MISSVTIPEDLVVHWDPCRCQYRSGDDRTTTTAGMAVTVSPTRTLLQVVVSCGVLDSVVSSLSHESTPVRTAADGVVAAVARSTSGFAHRVMTAG